MTQRYEEIKTDADIAQMIYDLRMRAELSQKQLAKQIQTTASVICRLENADYEGHSLSMLRRIAQALGYRVEIHFTPLEPEQ